MSYLDTCLKKMTSQNLHPLCMDQFSFFYNCLDGKNDQTLDLSTFSALSDETVAHYNQIPEAPDSKDLLSKLAVIKLNGGLGTSMGLSTAKSLLPVRNNRSFLDLILMQLSQLSVHPPLLLMNSFATDKDTQEFCKHHDYPIHFFKQNQFPRLLDDQTYRPFTHSDPNQEWNPPGHGDCYVSLAQNNLIETLLDQGISYLFISNSDNLGATVDPRFLQLMESEGHDFLLEETEKTALDSKGGMVLENSNKKQQLVEIAQISDTQKDLFMDSKRFPYFNTNSLWIRLETLAQKSREKTLKTDVIVNRKTIDGTPIIQLESAIASAISCFDHPKVVVVPRDRFRPVKTTSDLLLLQSSLFSERNGRIQSHSHQDLPQISIEGPLSQIQTFSQSFGGPLNLKDLLSLRINGDFYFEEGVTLSGHIIFENTSSEKVRISNTQVYTEGRYSF